MRINNHASTAGRTNTSTNTLSTHGSPSDTLAAFRSSSRTTATVACEPKVSSIARSTFPLVRVHEMRMGMLWRGSGLEKTGRDAEGGGDAKRGCSSPLWKSASSQQHLPRKTYLAGQQQGRLQQGQHQRRQLHLLRRPQLERLPRLQPRKLSL